MRPIVALLAAYPPDHKTFTGGVATATRALLEGLQAYQHEFEFHLISTTKAVTRDFQEQRDGIRFHFLSIPRTRWLRPRLFFRIAKTRREIRQLQPQVVHSQADFATALASLPRGCRRVHTVHGVLRDEARLRTGWERWAAYALLPLETILFRQCDAFICISEYAAQVVGPGRRTFRIPNAISSTFAHTIHAPVDDWPHLLFAGVLAPIKRPADLLMAHQRLRARFPTLRTSFCGPVEDAGYARQMEAAVVAQNIQGVEFLGTMSRERLADLFSRATALVVPSAQENAPMVIAEAMTVGVPVVATQVGAIGEMVRHGETGLLYAPGDVDALTDSLQLLLSDRALQHQLGTAARKVAVASYTPARVGQATVAVYRELLGQHQLASVSHHARLETP